MLRNLAWQTIDTLTRAQLVMFHVLSDQINLTPDDRRRALNLDESTWAAWAAFVRHGPLPSQPPLPVMLRRVGEICFNLSTIGSRDMHGRSPFLGRQEAR
jgi:hypothetical protein